MTNIEGTLIKCIMQLAIFSRSWGISFSLSFKNVNMYVWLFWFFFHFLSFLNICFRSPLNPTFSPGMQHNTVFSRAPPIRSYTCILQMTNNLCTSSGNNKNPWMCSQSPQEVQKSSEGGPRLRFYL